MEFKTLGHMQKYLGRMNPQMFHQHMSIYGYGGLGYIPKRRNRMIGGMATEHPDTRKYWHELYPEYGVDNMEDLITEFLKSGEDDDHKVNFLLKEAGDFIGDFKQRNEEIINQLLEKSKSLNPSEYTEEEYNKAIEDEFNDVIEGIKNIQEHENERLKIAHRLITEILKFNTQHEFTPEQNKKFDLIIEGKFPYENNPLFKHEDERAVAINPEDEKLSNLNRGVLTEEDWTNNPTMVEIIDNDKSTLYNTKNLSAYSDEFKNAMVKIATGDLSKNFDDLKDMSESEKSNIMNYIEKTFLEFIPIDLVKGNTIYEVKSFSRPLNQDGYQTLGKTKLQGYDANIKSSKNLKGVLKKNEYSYQFEFNPDGTKIKNIIFNFKGRQYSDPVFVNGERVEKLLEKIKFENIPILKNNSNDYKYYWLMSNKDITGYINPLDLQIDKSNNITEQMKDDGMDKIKIKNRDFKIMPNSYMQLLTNRIKAGKTYENKGTILRDYIKKTL
jgi:hypothetical protein